MTDRGGNFITAHYELIVLGAAVAALVAGGWFYVDSRGTTIEEQLQADRRELDEARAKVEQDNLAAKLDRCGVERVSLAAYSNAVRNVQKTEANGDGLVRQFEFTERWTVRDGGSDGERLVEDKKGNFLSSDSRFFCKQCAEPIHHLSPSNTCLLCGQPQEKVEVKDDTDGDGMPDKWERQYKLNPNDASDAGKDSDGDGFTNLEEFKAKTDPRDAASHPSHLADLRLQLPLRETCLPIVFKGVMKVPAGNRYQFFDAKRRNDYGKAGTTYSVLEGEEIKLDSGEIWIPRRYEEKTEQRKIAGSINTKKVDVSVATLERKSDKKTVQLVFGRAKTRVDVQATLVYSRGETREFTVIPGETIDLRGEKFKILTISSKEKKAEVELQSVPTGKKHTLSALER